MNFEEHTNQANLLKYAFYYNEALKEISAQVTEANKKLEKIHKHPFGNLRRTFLLRLYFKILPPIHSLQQRSFLLVHN